MRLAHFSTIIRGALVSCVLLLAQSPNTLAQNKHTLPLFVSASHQTLQGFVRIINHSARAGTVTIHATDDAGQRYGPVTLSLEARATQHFNSDNLRDGAPDKGLSGSIADGEGNWRLEFETDLDIEPLAYTRPRGDGFLTSTHDVVTEGESIRWHVPIFNPGKNTAQHSWLRVINTADIDTEVVIEGLDDDGASPPGGRVRFSLPAGAARMLSAKALEEGSAESDFAFDGAFGVGEGKWQLFVSADQPIQVMSLLFSSSGHLTNLSTGGPPRADAVLESDPSIVGYLAGLLAQGESPGFFAAIVDQDGIHSIAVAGVRKQGSPQTLVVNDFLRINSNTKAMTSTMLATLVADGTFIRGWHTTIADVFPELLNEIHPDYHAVDLRHLVTMTGGIARNATDWWDYWWQYVVEARYNILRDNLIPPPAGSAGEYNYSNLGYMVAGAMAERVTGKSWESLMEERLFAPLGMTAAKPSFQEGPYYKVDQPWGHWRNEGGSWNPQWFSLPPAWGPAANAYVSIEAWTKFIRLWFLDSEPAILDRSSLDELIGADFNTPTPYSNTYGAGWMIFNDESTGEMVISHDGLSCCWATWLRVLPHRGVAYIAAANARFKYSTGDLLSSIIDHLIEHDSPRSAGLSRAVKDYVLAPHGSEIDMALQPLNQRTTQSPSPP